MGCLKVWPWADFAISSWCHSGGWAGEEDPDHQRREGWPTDRALLSPSVIRSHPHVTKSPALTWVRDDERGHSSLDPSTEPAPLEKNNSVGARCWEGRRLSRLDDKWRAGSRGLWSAPLWIQSSLLFTPKKVFLGHLLMGPRIREMLRPSPCQQPWEMTRRGEMTRQPLPTARGPTPSSCYFNAWQMFTVEPFYVQQLRTLQNKGAKRNFFF